MKTLPRNCKAKSEVSPVIACEVFRNPERGDAGRGSWKSLSKIKPDFLLNDSFFIPPTEIFPRLMCVQGQRGSSSQVPSNPVAVFPPVQSRDLIQIPFPFSSPEAWEEQQHRAGDFSSCSNAARRKALTPCDKGAELSCWQGSVIRAVLSSFSIS